MIIDHFFQNVLSLSNYLNWILPACKVVFGCEDRQEISKITFLRNAQNETCCFEGFHKEGKEKRRQT